MEIIKVLQAWCLSILNVLVQICLIPFRRFVRAPDSFNRQTPPDPQNPFDELAPFSASTSTEPWQIFINHRGSDVKYTLASKIHRTLEGMGYRAFLDVQALEPGDVIPAEIQAAMISASLHIAIFSPNYAQSPWCLAELSFVIKTGAKIIPIFYHVEPSDLRWVQQGKGKYAHAFSEHVKKGRYTEEKLNQWKEALYNISFDSGFLVKDNEDEANVLKNIVNSALRVLKNVPLWVAKHPIGLDELVQGFQSVTSGDKAKIKGIVGMGGSGKTTLAKELFNIYYSSFNRCSFVSDVRDAASRSALPDKQKKLLEDLGVDHLSFDSVDEGMAILANRLSSHRALIVLDDVDHIDQLNALFPGKDSPGSPSMVIVTSRELGVLQSWGLSCIYKMPGFNMSHARQLFCWHAFLQPSAPAEFETLVVEFLRACNGLPLSLTVLGALLYGIKSKDYWKSQLDKISRILPGDIKKRLQVSYDSLDEEEREMFLDVACFLIGETKSTAIALWDGMDLSGLHGLQTLVNKCLVELVYERNPRSNIFEDNIRMHDHLRDMGKEIAGRHSSYRLWWPGQIQNLKKHLKVEMPIRGIRPPATFVAFKQCRHQLMRITNGLQILHVEKNDFTEEFESLSEDVVWLRWDSFPLKSLPPWLTLRHLRVLELDCSHQSEELWEGNVDPPLQLRKLSISSTHGIKRLPTSIGRLQYLKMLSIRFNGSSLPEEFCGLLSLECVRLHCENLCSLPAGFGNLLYLKYIDLFACYQLSTLPDSFSQLIRLESLTLFNCYNLSSLPAGFGNLVNLKHINLEHCSKLSTLPDSFKHLIHLEHLDLTCCDKLKLKSDAFEHIKKLKFLELKCCKELEGLPNQIVNQTSLTKLDLIFCDNLMEIETLPVSLKILVISASRVLKKIRCLTGLVCLEILTIKLCPQLEELSGFADLASLKEFEMSQCPKVVKIEGLQHSKSLKHLRIQGTKWKVPGIQSLEKAEGLETLQLECDPISALKPFIQSIKECPRIMCIQGPVSRVVEPVVDSRKFPDLELREVTARWSSDRYGILRSLDSADYFCYWEGKESNWGRRKVVKIYVHLANANANAEDEVARSFAYGIKTEKAVIVTGRRGRLMEAFNQLLALVE